MRDLKEIRMVNTHANGPAVLPDLGQGNVYTVIWSLFEDNGDFVKQYCTEVTAESARNRNVLKAAIATEGFSPTVLLDHAELDFVINHAVEVIHDGHAKAGRYNGQ